MQNQHIGRLKQVSSSRRALATVVTTLIILVVSMGLAGVVTYYGINVSNVIFQQESLQISMLHVWCLESESDLLIGQYPVEAAFFITNTGSIDVVINKITIHGEAVPWNQVYSGNGFVSSDLEYIPVKDESTNNAEAFLLATDTVGTITMMANRSDIALPSSKSIVVYVMSPGSISVYDVGLTVGVALFTSQSLYYQETTVEGYVPEIPSRTTPNSTPIHNPITNTPNPTPTHNPITNSLANGIWVEAGDGVTPTILATLYSHGVRQVYMATGQWISGTINRVGYASNAELQTAISEVHSFPGMKIYAWVLGETYDVDLTSSDSRATHINAMVSFLGTFNFDGMDDDVETGLTIGGNWNNAVTYWNDAHTTIHALGKEYYITMVDAWLQGSQLSSSQMANIHVDRIQPMLYGNYLDKQLTFKTAMNFVLSYATSPVGLAIHTNGAYQTFATSMQWMDQQFNSGTPKTNFAGVDIFWYPEAYGGMTDAQWITWDSWSTKN
jgi:hypothetical protein